MLEEHVPQKKEPGGSCTNANSTTDCLDSNSECTTVDSSTKCRCTSQYYDNDLDDSNVGGVCVPKSALGNFVFE